MAKARTNVICISDEAHRSQVNLDQKVRVTENGVRRTFGFAKYLHDSLPNATYVGFTGTPIDATLDVFGEVIDAYTMTESVKDEITVRIVYEGRAAKVLLDNSKLAEIEDYYAQCAEDGASDYQIEESKKANAQMNAILGDPVRIKALAKDFVKHYESRVSEGSTVKGKAMFVSSSRQIAYDFYKEVIALRPEWAEVKVCEEGAELTEKERKEIKPMERIKMIMTRGKDDPKELYDILGNKDYRKELDRQFKNGKSNFKIAILVDMWLTGFDVPFLDTIYIDKPIQRHNLIQTISRVNRKFEGKEKGLVVDYIGIKRQMNQALAQYSKADGSNFEEIEQSIVVVKDHLDLLGKIFHKFDKTSYFSGSPLQQLECLNMAAEFVQVTQEIEKRFMYLVKRLKAAYDICCGSDAFSQTERDHIHFYLAVRSIVFKLTKGNAPDTAQMNARVREMIKEALQSDGVEEIFKMGEDHGKEVDIFDDDYLAKIEKIKLPNTKIKLLQQLLAKAIDDFKKVNKIKGTDFSKGAKIRGFDARTVSKQLRAAFYGTTASEIMVRDESYEVNLQMAGPDKNSMADLENFYLINSHGDRVPLNTVASITHSRGFAGIRRVDADRTVTVTGDVDTRVANAADIIADTRKRFLPELNRRFPNITIGLEGQEKEMKASMGGMIKAFAIGIFGIFCLLSFQFKSYQEPLVVMVTIPFAFIGVVWGHIVMGLDLCMPSILGFVSLAGIVVNDSILLVSFIKLNTARGKSAKESGKLASRERFRAVMLTSITTIAGLLPLLSERSMQAQILIPLACSIVFGLLMSTILVLLVVPCLYAILADFNLVRIETEVR